MLTITLLLLLAPPLPAQIAGGTVAEGVTLPSPELIESSIDCDAVAAELGLPPELMQATGDGCGPVAPERPVDAMPGAGS